MFACELRETLIHTKGIGKKTAAVLSRNNLKTISDLIHYYPRAYSDRTKLLDLREAARNGSGTVLIKVIDHRLIGTRYKKFLKVIVSDTKGNYGALLCFNRNFLASKLRINDLFFVTGKFSVAYNEIQSSSFEFEEGDPDNYDGKMFPIYPLFEGVSQNVFRKGIEDIFCKFEDRIENEIPLKYMKKHSFMDKKMALHNLHFPRDEISLKNARDSLIYEEFFFQKLFLLERKDRIAKQKKKRKNIDFNYKKILIKNLGFSLMDYQQSAIEQIEKKMFSSDVFSILLQGDVGSGKTLVSLVSMLSVVESGYQAVLLVPTEVLAVQHFNSINNFISGLPVKTAILTGSTSKKDRAGLVGEIKNGEIDIIIGTHALFSDDVVFYNLGYVVIDEQHRFGVEQRYKLLNKGVGVDLLLMTATPIPQSLALALYGDLELVTMRGKINGRLPVKTWVVEDDKERLAKMYQWIIETIRAEDGRAIFVYPLIEDSESSDYKNLTEEFENLKKIFELFGVEYIHSKLAGSEKECVIDRFRRGETRVIVSTTVIEVGLDVPAANIIVVENADAFGLSTLHQLRGRVGRNNKQGYMILVAANGNLTDQAVKRLEVIKNETDGFKIAEEDLKIRGPGDFIGYRQSGSMNIKLADFVNDFRLIEAAAKDAMELFSDDKELSKTDNLKTKESFYKRIENYMDYDMV